MSTILIVSFSAFVAGLVVCSYTVGWLAGSGQLERELVAEDVRTRLPPTDY